ncbi:Ca2+-binding RTX toxin-like protein [Rhizobium sp. BK313]|uniref:peroxidase family protein n=1 Tax=Rhizobium sp. BK313 TaxID=2587081 RepID=UPI00105C084F|nr:peroxidase family protein [Rhizobium sp. BK313]MBB3458979.1 Ca2+-binding RTX toxin-like protein [Rhizobium sp. BK313]
MVQINKHDLTFILKQIKIAEANSAGTALTEIYVDDAGNVVPAGTPGAVLAISHPLAPYGLRTVDGSYNNLIEGREQWGAADNPFPHVADPSYRDEDDDAMPFPGYVGPDATIPDASGPLVDQNNDYGTPGSVVDADPRIISNLIVDQTLDNPAAIYAALTYAGYSGAALNTALTAIVQAKNALDTAVTNAGTGAGSIPALQAAVTAAQLASDNAQSLAIAANAQAAADQAAYDAAQAEVATATQGRDAALAAYTGLLTDAVPNGSQLAEIDAALSAFTTAQALLEQEQAEVAPLGVAATASAEAAGTATAQAAAAAQTLSTAQQALLDAQNANSGAVAAIAAAQTALDTLLSTHGVEMEGNSVIIPNVSPDEGLSAPYNSWFTLFGQFFDHGLDLVAKQGGTVYIPLQPDDPLYNPASPRTNFMVLTRTTPDADNLTTPWVDQNQTYTSNASHQMFLREYAMVDGKPLATGMLLQGDRGLATWADVKEQAATMLGFNLTDADVGNVPLFAVDDYGEFIRGPNGFPQLVIGLGADNAFGTVDDVLLEGNPTANGGIGVTIPATAFRTGHAFLDDIAHSAKTVNDRGQVLTADADDAVGLAAGTLVYDDELLDAHYITGDGRGNENIGLSAVHHIFHSEHNNMVEQVKEQALASGDLAFLNEWLRVDVAVMPTDPAAIAALQWDGERLFQAARFTTEMQYQHLVFEEFARKVQPDVDAFVFNPSTDINPAIFAEFAHVVYRFGHSMLREQVAATNPDGSDASLDLFDAFLNPLAFGSETIDHDAAAGAIVRGMTNQVGNEIDEFVTHVLRNQLVGIPLDLAAINIARGRDAGIPSLNEARAQFKEAASGDTQLDPYENWIDFALNLKNPASIVNFIAAYGTHASLASAATVDAKRDAATKLVFGDASLDEADRQDFLNGRNSYASNLGGLNLVDLWVGGLAEKKMAFGGMLGSTFSFIFELQLENLQNADRFYYLSRVQGLNFLNELENNSFAKMVLNNTDLGESGYAVPGDIFSVPDHVLYMDHAMQNAFDYEDPQQEDPFLEVLSPMVERRDAAGNLINPVDNPAAVTSYIRINSNDHVLIQGTNSADHIVAGGGDDSVWGRGGNDRIEAGYGVDKIHGGEGDDIITNNGTDIGEVDMLHGEDGNDVIHGGSGLALIFGNKGQDFIITGPDGKEAFGGEGNDFILGGDGGDFLLGNEGDDWLEGGNGFDTTAGDNSELFFNSTIIGHDVMFAGENEHDFDAESGDDIMVQGESVMRNEGMLGYDWSIHKGNSQAADSDLTTPIFTTDEQDILRDRFDAVEALSGWEKDDRLWGDNRGDLNGEGEIEGNPNLAGAENTMVGHELTQAGVDRISGLRAVLGDWVAAAPADPAVDREKIIAFDDGNILLGGGGDDTIEGRGGNDVIDGDAWLNVRISIRDTNGVQLATVDSMAATISVPPNHPYYSAWNGKTLQTLMLSGAINPVQLNIVREILDGEQAGDIDTAVYWDDRTNYSFSTGADGTLLVSHTGFDTANVPAGANNVSDGLDKLRNIERLQFADGALNVITGTAGNNTGATALNGTAGDDLIMGLAGNDTLNGNGGNDILIGGAGNDALNGGAGDDTYAFGVADGTDTITESSGTDRITIMGGALTGLSFSETTTGAGNDNLVIQFNGQQITVTDHFETTGETVEFINLDGSTYEGYAFAGDYAISTDDNGDRTAAAGVNTVLAGTTAGDTLLGDTGDDLLFGNGGNDDLDGGAGDDLLVGGTGSDEMVGGLGADTMVGGADSDTYTVDDAGDVVVEATGGGTTDTVETTLAAYTLTANVENLTYTGAGAFAGTGNDLANRIEGGAGVDTLTGLGGNDTYVVTAGDIVVEAANGGTDTIQSAASYVLGAELENLTLTGNAVIDGTGNGLNNVIAGNTAANQLFGGAGNDTIDGGDGSDLIDGGIGNDTLNGGGGNDTDTIIGGAGNDVIDVSNGNDVVVYNAAGFGNDTINSFDAAGGTATTQDRIDLSALGITVANFASRVTIEDVVDAGTDDTRVTVRDAANAVIGTIFIEEVDGLDITASDFVLATTSAPIGGATAGNNNLNGGAGNDTIDALAGNDTVNGNAGNDTIVGNLGNDTINAGAGDDTIIWNANATGATDGRDLVNGGTETTVGDTFVVNGNASAETYRIYTRAAWDAVPGNVLSSLNAATEIVITRNGTNNAAIIAELTEIEEIRINGADPAGAGTAGNDSFELIGDFSGTHLRLNTVTIDGDQGDDTIDISALTSAHRIVFRSNGGNDTVVGTLRPQDVIELPAGTTLDEYTISETGGVKTMTNGTHTITFVSEGMPTFQDENGEAEDEDDDHPNDGDSDVEDSDDPNEGTGGSDDEDDVDENGGNAPAPIAARTLVGTAGSDVLLGAAAVDTILAGAGADILVGEEGDDILRGEDGDDVVSAGGGVDVVSGGTGDDEIHGGDGNDMLFGNAGKDMIYGDEGNDIVEGGADDDQIWSGAGNDTVLATNGDGNDLYWGGDGSDTLDYAAATANLTVDIGSGYMQRGSVSGSGTGTDVTYGFENFVGGSGHDVITASVAANVIDGGLGDDVFRFTSVAAAQGDKIYGFQPGDKIDFSQIDADTGTAGNQHFTLAAGATLTAAGQIVVTHDTVNGEELTTIRGNVDGDPDADFELLLTGTHNLKAADFNGVS